MSRLGSGLPSWARLVLAAAGLIGGVVIIVRPTASLDLLAFLIGAGLVLGGLVDFAEQAERDRSDGSTAVVAFAVAIGWLAAGVFVLLFPGLTVRWVAVLVGVGLLVSAALSAVRAFHRRRSIDQRVTDVALAVAGAVFGVVALVWLDITLLIICLVLGARLIIGSITLGWRALRGDEPPSRRAQGVRRRAWPRTVVALVAVLAAVATGSVSVALRSSSPIADPFYAAPGEVTTQPGRLLRSEPFTRGVPDNARGRRILYTTTRSDGRPALASALVVVPASGPGRWPVIDWAHGTTGIAQQCAPSLLDEPFESGALFVLPRIVEQGWALVATDYIGLGTEGPHPYLIGIDSAHAVLDAHRAARRLPAADLGDESVIWGHSQGGGAALWTGALAGAYAPELSVSAVAALAPAANLPALVANERAPGGSIFAAYLFAAYSADYPDVSWRRYLRPGSQVMVRATSHRCLSGPSAFGSLVQVLALRRDPNIFATDPLSGPLGRRIEANIPAGVGDAPVLIAQGAADSLVLPDAQQQYVARLCSAGEDVDHRSYPGLGHVDLVEPASPLIHDLISWTEARFAGEPVAAVCGG